MSNATQNPELLRATVRRMVDSRDLRYFDSSDAGLAEVRTAGESIRRSAELEARVAAKPAEYANGVRVLLTFTIDSMDLGDLWRTVRALDRCPTL